MSPRMSADERRTVILDATIEEYGRTGLADLSIDAIAAQAGVSQPYVFRLFGTKKGLITAAIALQTDRVVDAFRAAAENRGPDQSVLEAMGLGYVQLMQDDPNELRCQLQSWAAASDPEIRQASRECYLKVWNAVAELSGADPETLRQFMAHGMLLTVVTALDLHDLFSDPASVAKEF